MKENIIKKNRSFCNKIETSVKCDIVIIINRLGEI